MKGETTARDARRLSPKRATRGVQARACRAASSPLLRRWRLRRGRRDLEDVPRGRMVVLRLGLVPEVERRVRGDLPRAVDDDGSDVQLLAAEGVGVACRGEHDPVI